MEQKRKKRRKQKATEEESRNTSTLNSKERLWGAGQVHLKNEHEDAAQEHEGNASWWLLQRSSGQQIEMGDRSYSLLKLLTPSPGD